MNTRKLCSLFLLVIFLTSNSFAQVSKQNDPICNPDYAQLLVEQQVSQSKSLEETEKRIKILVSSANFLWKINEESSRKYYKEAFETAESRFKDKGFEGKSTNGLYVSQPDYRFDVISAISKKDSKWAKLLYEKLLKEFEEKAEDDKRDAKNKNREATELLRIAVDSAESNPDLSLQIVRRLMRYELTFNWYIQLYQIAVRNQQLADQIYGELLTNYANTETYRLLYLSAYPFANERIFGIEGSSLYTPVPIGISGNRDLQKRFLNTLFRKVLTLTPENTSKSLHIGMPETAVAFTAMSELEYLISNEFPELLQSFQTAKTYSNSVITNDILDSINQRDKLISEFNKGFEDKLEQLEKLDGEGKLNDSHIIKLIISLRKEEHFKKAEFWLLKINDSKAKEQTSTLFYFKRSKIALGDNQLSDARKFADKVENLEFRATLYFLVAEIELKDNKDRFKSLELLDEIYKMASKSDDSVSKVQVNFGLANKFAKLDFQRAYDSLNNAIKTTNKLENPNIFKTNEFIQISTKEISHYATYDSIGFNMVDVFRNLSKNEFSLTLGQAQDFTDEYYRTLAVIATVKNCAEIKPKK